MNSPVRVAPVDDRPQTAPFPTPQAALAARAAAAPEREAIVFPAAGRRLTFSQWQQASLALARALLDRGIRPGDHVALLAESRWEWLVVQVGVAAMGGVLVPLNTHYRREDLAYALGQSRARAILLSPRFRSNAYLDMVEAVRPGLADLALVVTLERVAGQDCLSDLLAEGAVSRSPLPDVPAEAVGSLQYTSGTTGFPKGALLTHRGMLECAWQAMRRLRLGAEDRYTSIIPLFHCAGCIMGALGCLQVGATYVGVPAFDPVDMFRVIAGERCTALSGVPTSYLAMLNHPERASHDLSSLRTGTCGGADCHPEVLAACVAAFPIPELVQVYGQTESCTLIAMPDCRDVERLRDCGHPLDGHTVRITDPETGKPLPAGAIGQIEARGVMTMVGYFDRPEDTREALTADGWLKTGDLGSLTPDGRLVVAGGRLKDMIIRGGENIYPAEVEIVLLTHPAVAEAAVFAVPDAYYGEAVGAALRLRSPVSASDLAAHCQARIARFKAPAHWFEVQAFPMTSSGKIRKVALRELAAAGGLAALP